MTDATKARTGPGGSPKGGRTGQEGSRLSTDSHTGPWTGSRDSIRTLGIRRPLSSGVDGRSLWDQEEGCRTIWVPIRRLTVGRSPTEDTSDTGRGRVHKPSPLFPVPYGVYFPYSRLHPNGREVSVHRNDEGVS